MKKINNKKAQMGTAVIVGLVFAIILVVIGITIATNLNTTATTLTAGQFSMTQFDNLSWNNATITPIGTGGVTSVVVGNDTYVLGAGNYTVSGTTGVATVLLNNSDAENITAAYINYSYQAFGYVTGVTSTMILLIPLFLGLAALGIAALFVTKRV